MAESISGSGGATAIAPTTNVILSRLNHFNFTVKQAPTTHNQEICIGTAAATPATFVDFDGGVNHIPILEVDRLTVTPDPTTGLDLSISQAINTPGWTAGHHVFAAMVSVSPPISSTPIDAVFDLGVAAA
jgi:hypothetical protein